MGQTNEQLRNKIVTSIHGRRLGIDIDRCLVGPIALKQAVTDLTSATTNTVPAHGLVNVVGTSLQTSAAQTYKLSNPIPGVDVTICNVNAATSAASPGSTAMTMIRPSTAFYILSSEGSTMTTINLAAGAAVTLTGLSTALYQVKNRTTLAGVIINGTT